MDGFKYVTYYRDLILSVFDTEKEARAEVEKRDCFFQKVKDESKQEPTWISVNDRLPDLGHCVDIYTKNYGRVCNVHAEEENRFYDKANGETYTDATHWMYRPEPPKEGE